MWAFQLLTFEVSPLEKARQKVYIPFILSCLINFSFSVAFTLHNGMDACCFKEVIFREKFLTACIHIDSALRVYIDRQLA